MRRGLSWLARRILSVGLLLALGFALAVAVKGNGDEAWTPARESKFEPPTVGDIAELAECLTEQQSAFLPIAPPDSATALRQPGGLIAFAWKEFPEEFTGALIGRWAGDVPLYDITIVEDPDTRETVFFNADGKAIYALKPAEDYDPLAWLKEWMAAVHFGTTDPEYRAWMEGCYDPARIQVDLTLLPSEYIAAYAAAAAKEAAELEASGGGGIGLMRWDGGSVTGIVITAIERVTNGIRLTVAYPDDFTNQLDVFNSADLIPFWWDLSATTNVSASTNWIEWTDATVTNTNAAVRFYAAGNADLDTDNDGLANAREMLMYHTSTNSTDTDGDGIGDYTEVITNHTDPNDPDTNKPTVTISFPTNQLRWVWVP
jgi:hypothetical protein